MHKEKSREHSEQRLEIPGGGGQGRAGWGDPRPWARLHAALAGTPAPN